MSGDERQNLSITIYPVILSIKKLSPRDPQYRPTWHIQVHLQYTPAPDETYDGAVAKAATWLDTLAKTAGDIAWSLRTMKGG